MKHWAGSAAIESSSISKRGFGPVLLHFIWILKQGDFRVSAPENAALPALIKPRHIVLSPTFHALRSPLNVAGWHVWGERRARAERGKAPTAMNKGGRWVLEKEAWRREEEEEEEWTDKKRDWFEARGERSLEEPWEVLLNCQIATSCKLFTV